MHKVPVGTRNNLEIRTWPQFRASATREMQKGSRREVKNSRYQSFAHPTRQLRIHRKNIAVRKRSVLKGTLGSCNSIVLQLLKSLPQPSSSTHPTGVAWLGTAYLKQHSFHGQRAIQFLWKKGSFSAKYSLISIAKIPATNILSWISSGSTSTGAGLFPCDFCGRQVRNIRVYTPEN